MLQRRFAHQSLERMRDQVNTALHNAGQRQPAPANLQPAAGL